MKTKKNLKPIEHDIHLKYLCPNPSCCCPHWLSYKEASTKKFKVVCDCGQIFNVRRIKTLNIEYITKKRLTSNPIDGKIPGVFETKNESIITEPIDNSVKPIYNEPVPPKDIKQLAIEHMKNYGFSEKESCVMIEKALEENPEIDDYIVLVKHSLFWISNE